VIAGNGRGEPSDPAKKTPPQAAIGPELRARLVERLRDDVIRVRAYMSQDFDGWGIA
jgi:hypothetical protein